MLECASVFHFCCGALVGSPMSGHCTPARLAGSLEAGGVQPAAAPATTLAQDVETVEAVRGQADSDCQWRFA